METFANGCILSLLAAGVITPGDICDLHNTDNVYPYPSKGDDMKLRSSENVEPSNLASPFETKSDNNFLERKSNNCGTPCYVIMPYHLDSDSSLSVGMPFCITIPEYLVESLCGTTTNCE
jgi:hypothetical protein